MLALDDRTKRALHLRCASCGFYAATGEFDGTCLDPTKLIYDSGGIRAGPPKVEILYACMRWTAPGDPVTHDEEAKERSA